MSVFVSVLFFASTALAALESTSNIKKRLFNRPNFGTAEAIQEGLIRPTNGSFGLCTYTTAQNLLFLPLYNNIPTYYVNIDGQSPGVACNVARYILRTGRKIFTFGGPSDGDNIRPDSEYSDRGATYPYNPLWFYGIKDEFPFHSTQEGLVLTNEYLNTGQGLIPGFYYKSNSQVMYINLVDIISNKYQLEASLYKNISWNCNNIRSFSDGTRGEPLKQGEIFNVAIAHLPKECGRYAMEATLKPGKSVDVIGSLSSPDALLKYHPFYYYPGWGGFDFYDYIDTVPLRSNGKFLNIAGRLDPNNPNNYNQIYGYNNMDIRDANC